MLFGRFINVQVFRFLRLYCLLVYVVSHTLMVIKQPTPGNLITTIVWLHISNWFAQWTQLLLLLPGFKAPLCWHME